MSCVDRRHRRQDQTVKKRTQAFSINPLVNLLLASRHHGAWDVVHT